MGVQRIRKCLIQRNAVTDFVVEGQNIDLAAILVPNGLTLGVRTYQRINSRCLLGRDKGRMCSEDQADN
jgi:hypothetical protein